MANCKACEASGKWCGRCDAMVALRVNFDNREARREAVEWHRLRMSKVAQQKAGAA